MPKIVVYQTTNMAARLVDVAEDL